MTQRIYQIQDEKKRLNQKLEDLQNALEQAQSRVDAFKSFEARPVSGMTPDQVALVKDLQAGTASDEVKKLQAEIAQTRKKLAEIAIQEDRARRIQQKEM